MLRSPYVMTTQIATTCGGYQEPCGEPSTHVVVLVHDEDDDSYEITIAFFCAEHAEAANVVLMDKVKA